MLFTSYQRKTHQIIRENSHLSPIFYKKDLGTGPRYCPSIEHKVCLFADKERHQIFVEPESRELDTIYLQGLSTSLPVEIQEKALRTLPGFERARVKKWGYAIEYDVLDSTQLKNTLETKLINNFFAAGQINGTTGYEEAAAQGIIAGINASCKLNKKEPLVLKRNEAYIGVLIDDLVKGVDDPYRLFPSRAEYRSLLRHDNTDTRLYPITQKLGLLSEGQKKEFQRKQELQKIITQKLQELKFTFSELIQYFPQLKTAKRLSSIKITINAYDLLIKGQKDVSLVELSRWIPEIQELTWETQRECEVDIKYKWYIERQEQEAEKMKKNENKLLPPDLDYDKIHNLSLEEKEKLKKIRPASLAQAGRIAGINPTGIQILSRYCRNNP